jgi:hypothetical protein
MRTTYRGYLFFSEPLTENTWVAPLQIKEKHAVFSDVLFVVESHKLKHIFSSSQGLASILHDSHRFGSPATRGDQAKEGHQEGSSIRQGLDRRWVCQGDRKHGIQLMHLCYPPHPFHHASTCD